ncbi:hypothetical protein V8C86DRAFT_3120017 [Haematococcus lacustris]
MQEEPEAELPVYDENEAWEAWSMGTYTTDVEEGVAPQSDIARDAAEFEETLRKHAEAQAKANAKEAEEGPQRRHSKTDTIRSKWNEPCTPNSGFTTKWLMLTLVMLMKRRKWLRADMEVIINLCCVLLGPVHNFPVSWYLFQEVMNHEDNLEAEKTLHLDRVFPELEICTDVGCP